MFLAVGMRGWNVRDWRGEAEEGLQHITAVTGLSGMFREDIRKSKLNKNSQKSKGFGYKGFFG